MKIVSIVCMDLSFLLFIVAFFLMFVGMGTYIVKFWGQDIAKAMKEDRLPSASKLTYTGARMVLIGIVFITIGVCTFGLH